MMNVKEKSENLKKWLDPTRMVNIKRAIAYVFFDYLEVDLEDAPIREVRQESKENIVLYFRPDTDQDDIETVLLAIREAISPDLLGDPLIRGRVLSVYGHYKKVVFPYLVKNA